MSFGLFALAFALFTPATAQTADGETPAEELVCDDYEGAAFGICNAYCEAIDCDEDPNASVRACTRLEDHFLGATGDEMPLCDADAPVCSETDIQECSDAGGSAFEFEGECLCVSE